MCPIRVLKALNQALRFLLELCLLAAFAYWGYEAGSSSLMRIALAVLLPLVAAAVWGAFVAPKAAVDVGQPVRLVIEVALFGLAVAALADLGHESLAIALAAAYLVNRVMLFTWG